MSKDRRICSVCRAPFIYGAFVSMVGWNDAFCYPHYDADATGIRARSAQAWERHWQEEDRMRSARTRNTHGEPA